MDAALHFHLAQGGEAWSLYFNHNDDSCGLPRGIRGFEISLRPIIAGLCMRLNLSTL